MRLRHLAAGLSQLRLREFAMRRGRCPFCGPSVFVRLNADEAGLRCVRCTSSAVHLAIGRALLAETDGIAGMDVCELSTSGPLAGYLRDHARSAMLSEYFADLPPGSIRNGIRCEDVQQLTYRDASFDLVTHTEVMEHVPDDARAFAELHRVLRPGGVMLFTVPLHGGPHTVERARLHNDRVEYLLDPVYHTDPLRDGKGILAYRDYGLDILDRLRMAGFEEGRDCYPRGNTFRSTT